MDEAIPVPGYPTPERLVFNGRDVGLLPYELRQWFEERGHRVEVLPTLLIFRTTGKPWHPSHTAFVGETVIWDPARKHLYVESTNLESAMVQPPE